MLSGGPHDHVVVFYDTDDELAAKVAEYLLDAMKNGGVGVIVATPGHRAAIEARLEQAGINLSAAREHGSYVALDADEVLSQFMLNGFADAASFWRVVSPVLKKATRKRRQVHVFGELVALLWERGKATAAVDLEALWNELASQYTFSLLCAYPADVLSDLECANELAEMMSAHSDHDAGQGRGEDAMSL